MRTGGIRVVLVSATIGTGLLWGVGVATPSHASPGLDDETGAGIEVGADYRFVDQSEGMRQVERPSTPVRRPPEEPRRLTPSRIAELIEDLAHDDVKHNALAAMGKLYRAQAAIPALERALSKRDRQQRQLAALLLWGLVDKPSSRLLEVSCEGLHADRMPYDRETETYVGFLNARRFTIRLLDHIEQARHALVSGLYSPDLQQRFLSAFLLAKGRRTEHAFRISQILLPHLRDNKTSGDALMSAHALWTLGKPVLPYVRAAKWRADEQARILLDRIEINIVRPPSRRALRARGKMRRISSTYWDPVVQYDIDRSHFVSFEGSAKMPPRVR